MTEHEQRQALAAVRFNSVETPDHVWSTSPSHVDGLHERLEREIAAAILDARASDGPSPIGLVLIGQKGVGKTHTLGWVRRRVQLDGGYFFLIELGAGKTFWEDAAEGVRGALLRADDAGETQLRTFLRRLCDWVEVADPVAGAVIGDAPLTVEHLNAFLLDLRRLSLRTAVECGDTLRALVLYAAADPELNDLGKDYLDGFAETGQDDRKRWGIRPRPRLAKAMVADISRLFALTGPCVIAIDQLDTLVAKSTNKFGEAVQDPVLAMELALIADGLMQLRETTRRTLSLVACLPNSWNLLEAKATDTVPDRFRVAAILGSVRNARLGRALVEKWLGVIYRRIGFVPPHPTWPVAPSAFESWDEYTPRQLLKRIHAHAESCLHGRIRELESFDAQPSEPPSEAAIEEPAGPEPDYFTELDARFAELRAAADVSAALDPATEDDVMPDLLLAALKAWITEFGNDDLAWETDPPPSGRGHLHAGLRHVVDEALDLQEHWMFRAINNKPGVAVTHRLTNARSAAQLRAGADNRHLVLIREGRWSGARTLEMLREIEQFGGRRATITPDDLRTFSALKEMLTRPSRELLIWLEARKPATGSALLRGILPDGSVSRGRGQDSRPPPAGDAIVLDGVRIELESLRKHAVVFAGSGSGKTVLIRRIVEECALRGVSAIVLDPNNDLARLGEGWPHTPREWESGDAERAREYLDNTDVVVWTPGRAGGRPLSFHPLPDFSVVADDEDEFTAAVEAAVATLAPHGKVNGTTKAAARGRAVLREALMHYARTGSRSLSGFVEMLADLPEGVSQLGSGTKMAADLAETLTAAMVNDPMFGGTGAPADPAVLLTPAAGKRARVSVISFVGLPSEEQRQGFVNQLELEIFAWIKRNPAGDRPLGGLFVMDEAQTLAPSGASTASTHSTIILASQARKYGLGLLFATQAPKGLHNQVTGNATTQFFGRLNSPAQIAAANDMARAKGSTVGDISLLERGQFYVTGETFGFRRMRAPLCLSHHPASPLRLEEVIERARDGRPR